MNPSPQGFPTRLAEIEGCQFASFEAFQHAHRERRVGLGVDRTFSLMWSSLLGTHPSPGERVFGLVMSWAMVWAPAVLIPFAWSSLGFSALLLVLVSFLASAVCRPWRAQWTWLVALGFLVFTQGLPSWSGGMWLLTAFLVCGYYEWCSDRFTERLLGDEALLAMALASGRAVLQFPES